MPEPAFKPLRGRDDDYLKIVVPAAARGDLAALDAYLQERPEDLTRLGPHGRTLLWEAARRGKHEAVRWLADRGAAIDVPGCYHSETTLELTPLAIAQFRRKARAEEVLRELGAEDDLYYAAYCGQAETVLGALRRRRSLLDEAFPLSRDHAVPLLAYALVGSSRQLAVGPVAMDSLLVAVGVGALVDTGTPSYLAYAILLALMVGLMQLAMGFARLGVVVNFLSRPVIAGFSSAAASCAGRVCVAGFFGIR